jgi:hypothetical protein
VTASDLCIEGRESLCCPCRLHRDVDEGGREIEMEIETDLRRLVMESDHQDARHGFGGANEGPG